MEHMVNEALAAREHLATHGWIPRRAESFRHLPPPGAEVWLGGDGAQRSTTPPSIVIPAEAGIQGVRSRAARIAPDARVARFPEALDPRLRGNDAGGDAGGDAEDDANDGWSLLPFDGHLGDAVDARWLDAGDGAQRAELFAGLPQPGEDEAAPFAWAHRALVRRGLRLRIPAAATPVALRLMRRAVAAVEAPLLVIELEPGAQCVLLETHEAAPGTGTVQNLQVHVLLGAGASLQHLRVATPAAADQLAQHVHATLAQDASYRQCLLASGSAYHLQRIVLDLQGEGASAQAASVLLAAGTVLENQAKVRHGAARTRSAFDALALGSGAARIVGNAHTTIAAGCDDADVRQRLSGIPTSGQPRLVLRPHLEIYHDKVQAAHGATWGALPQEALFHARQRGLDERAAQALIIEGLARAVLECGLGDAEWLEAAGLDAWLAESVARHLAGAGVKEIAHG